MLVPNSRNDADKLVIFFHGNGEDIGTSMYFMEPIIEQWNAHAVAVEYPGYGVYKTAYNVQTEERFRQDCTTVYDYFAKTLRLNPQQIISFGRSIGSGPATLLAKNRKCAALMLFSPLMSVRDVAKDKTHWVLSKVAPDMFRNIDHISTIDCPTFIIHGNRDEIIDVKHASELWFKSGAHPH